MAACSRGFRALPRTEFIIPQCRAFSLTSVSRSGHNRWSKIKHDKGANDASRNLQRTILSRDIALASKLYGSNLSFNPRLAAVLAMGKKAGMPKNAMEAAIARGQGKSVSGAVLENVVFEVMMPASVAMIIDSETDNKLRIMQEVKKLTREHGGEISSINFLFQKKGRVTFERDERNLGVDDVLDEAIEAGAEDVELDDDGGIVVWTEPHKTIAAATALQKSLGLKVESSDIIWDANEETKVQIESEEIAEPLSVYIDALRDHPGVQGIYANIAQGNLPNDVWEDLAGRLDA